MSRRKYDNKFREKTFGLFCKAPRNAKGRPSVNYVANKAQVSRRTVIRWAEEGKWYGRLQKVESRTEEKLDERISDEEAEFTEKLLRIRSATVAYLEEHMEAVEKSTGKKMLPAKITELTNLCRYIDERRGKPGHHVHISGGPDLPDDIREAARKLGPKLLKELADGHGEESG